MTAADAAAEAAQRQAEAALRSVDAAMDSVRRSIDAEKSAALVALDRSHDAAMRAVAQQQQAAEAAKSAAEQHADAMRNVFDVLESGIQGLRESADGGMSPASGLAFIDQALSTATRTGYMPDAQALEDAIQAATMPLEDQNYATQFELSRDRMLLAGRLGQLQVIAQEQKTEAQLMVEAAQRQIELIEAARLTAVEQHEENKARTESHYGALLAQAQAQVDALNGINNTALSIADAMQQLGRAITSARTAAAASSQAAAAAGRPAGAQNTQLQAAAKALYYSTSTGYSTALFDAAVAPFGGPSAAFAALGWDGSREHAAQLRQIHGFAEGGFHAGGLRLVGEQGPELEVTGPARYYSAGQTESMLAGGEGVADEIRALRTESAAHARAMVQMQSRMTRMIEAWDGEGMPSARKEVA